MRFAVAHKAATYMMVGFAYAAMVTGGGIQPVIALSGLVGLIASWWWEPPNISFERWTWMWTIASVFALVYSVLTAVVTGDFLGVGAQFLIWLVVAKSYNRKTARDWQQIYLLAFLMLVAGSVLNADLTYGICFLGFVISTTWAMTLFHLRREMEDNFLVKHTSATRAADRVEVRRILDSKRIVGRRFFLGTGALSFGAFVMASVVFLAIPRVGFGFFLKNQHGLSMAGFNDGVKLGGHGVIKNDPTVVMRVEIDPKFGGRDKAEIHWRGVAFDKYEHGRWSRSPIAPATYDVVTTPRPGFVRFHLRWKDKEGFDPDFAVKQDIWLDPFDTDVLFGASMPRAFEISSGIKKKEMRNDEMRVGHGTTIHYTVWSELFPPSPEALRRADGNVPLQYAPYYQLPKEITPETRALAAQITAGLDNNYDKAKAIERWLETNLSYTLELEDPGQREPIDFFLFKRKKGHCEYFASAFVVLARIAGIPTRQVNGFLGGEWNEYKGYVAVRAGDAHSWAEVYFPGQGWVTFDATPAAEGGELGRGGTGFRAKMARFIDTLRFQWSKWVIEYDLSSQLELFKGVGGALKRAAIAVRDALKSALALWPVLLAMIGAAIGWTLWRRRRVDDILPGAIKIVRPPRSTVAEVYDGVIKQLAKHGTRKQPGQTPRELASSLTGKPGGTELAELTELYYAAEWGARRDPSSEARASELAIKIRDALRESART
jgi:transglutaminase-like putative cysteine protease